MKALAKKKPRVTKRRAIQPRLDESDIELAQAVLKVEASLRPAKDADEVILRAADWNALVALAKELAP